MAENIFVDGLNECGLHEWNDFVTCGMTSWGVRHLSQVRSAISSFALWANFSVKGSKHARHTSTNWIIQLIFLTFCVVPPILHCNTRFSHLLLKLDQRLLYLLLPKDKSFRWLFRWKLEASINLLNHTNVVTFPLVVDEHSHMNFTDASVWRLFNVRRRSDKIDLRIINKRAYSNSLFKLCLTFTRITTCQFRFNLQ